MDQKSAGSSTMWPHLSQEEAQRRAQDMKEAADLLLRSRREGRMKEEQRAIFHRLMTERQAAYDEQQTKTK